MLRKWGSDSLTPKHPLIHLNTTPIGVLPSHIEEELVDAC